MADSTSVDWNGFYNSLGSMPQQSGGMLVQQTPSDLTTRTVTTLPVNGSNWSNPTVAPNPYIGTSHWATQLPRSAPSTTTYYPADGSYGYNAATGAYEPRQPGNAYTVGPLKPSTNYGANSAVAAINKAAPAYIGQNHPALTLPQMASATSGGLPFATKYQSALRTAALMSQVGLGPKPVNNVTAQMKPRSLLDAVFGAKQGGFQKPSLLSMLGNVLAGAQMGGPAPARPASGFGSLGYAPSSSGQSNDYFTNARNGSVPDINYGISGSGSSGGARSLT